MRISDWSSDVCSSDLADRGGVFHMRDPSNEGREDERRDDHLDEAQKEVGKDREIVGDFGGSCGRVMRIHEPARRNPGDHGEDEDEGESSVHDCPVPASPRSEEHTSELRSLMRNSYEVFCVKTNIHTT